MTKKKPIVSDPLSPKNILAGKALNFKKPSSDPIKPVERIKSSSLFIDQPIEKFIRVTSIESHVTSPSKPSYKLIAFIIPIMKNRRTS